LPLPSQNLVDLLTGYGFKFLPVTAYHAQAISTLPNHHKDPFDRMIIAQAQCENLTVATYDTVFAVYLPGALVF
jgi:PIN domain nuclease of toxin-antitoxin system